MTPEDRRWAALAAAVIWGRLEGARWAGHDPYDGASESRLPQALLRTRVSRRLVTQTVKRSPVMLQPRLDIKPQADAYTLGHALLAAARFQGGGDRRAAERSAEAVPDLIAQLREKTWVDGDAMAWGYHFPVHTRFFSYVPPTPNLVVTAFVAKGMAAVTRCGLADCRSELRGAATFILTRLPRVQDGGISFGYIPGERAVVHNANMLAALVLCESAGLCEEPSWLDEALSAAQFTASHQAADGSWPYSEESYGRWVDSFHTGFLLDGLAAVARGTGDAHVQAVLTKGAAYYVAQLFGAAGEPKYHPGRAHPYDALSAAQGVETLHVALGGDAAAAVPAQLAWIRGHMVRPDGRVAYQVHRTWTDWREFPRWSSAPMMSALAGVATEGGRA